MIRREQIFDSDSLTDLPERTAAEHLSANVFNSFRSGLMRSDEVDSTGLEAAQAFEVFAGKSFYSSQPSSVSRSVLYSNSNSNIHHSNSNNYSCSNNSTGIANNSQYGVGRGASRAVESPAARLARIRAELTELVDDLSDLERSEDDAFWMQVQEEAKSLSDTAEDISNHPFFQAVRSNSTTNLSDLKKVLQNLKSPHNSSRIPSQFPASSSASHSFNHSNNSIDVHQMNGDYIELERRLAYIERLIGDSSGVEVVTPSSIVNRSSVAMSNTLPLVETLAKLEKRVALLDATNMELIRGKAAKLKEELERVGKTRQMLTDSSLLAAIDKVDDLSASISKVEPIADELPTVVMRLKTLEKVHSQSATFLNRLKEAEADIAVAKEKFTLNQAVIHSIKQGLSENIEIMGHNITNVESKIARSIGR